MAALAAGALSPSDLPTAVVAAPPAGGGASSVPLAAAAEPAKAKVKQEWSGEVDEMENSSEETSSSDVEKRSAKEEEDAAARGGGEQDIPEKQQHTEAMEVEDEGSEECNASNKRKAQDVIELTGSPPQGAGGAAEEPQEMEEEEGEESEDSEGSSSDSDSVEPLHAK